MSRDGGQKHKGCPVVGCFCKAPKRGNGLQRWSKAMLALKLADKADRKFTSKG